MPVSGGVRAAGRRRLLQSCCRRPPVRTAVCSRTECCVMAKKCPLCDQSFEDTLQECPYCATVKDVADDDGAAGLGDRIPQEHLDTEQIDLSELFGENAGAAAPAEPADAKPPVVRPAPKTMLAP